MNDRVFQIVVIVLLALIVLATLFGAKINL